MRIAFIVFVVSILQLSTAETQAQSSPFYSSLRQAQNCEPYRVGLTTPKLTTPQWVGEAGVDAVVILSIDDMRDAAKYEEFLRPLLDRLKRIDDRAPVSIFTNEIDPNEPQLQRWLKEGLSLEVHTVDHPCPLLSAGDFAKAKSTYDRCVDMMDSIPNSRAVAFRMPCCDSLNTPSPRFWKEVFEQKSAEANYLAIDSSVFNIFTSDDPDLGKELTTRENGQPRFRHYLPFKSFVNTIENYPYPYIVGESCWEFPCVVPSDWEAQNVQRPNNPETVRDLKRALDATVAKQGVMPIVFHPHGWIRSEQLVEFVDYAVTKYGKRVKFLNFAESLQRINKNLLGGVPLRTDKGNEFGVRLTDVNGDGFVDVMSRQRVNESSVTRVWNPSSQCYDVEDSHIDLARSNCFYLDGKLNLLTHDAAGLSTFKYGADGWTPSSLKLNASDLGEILDTQWHDVDVDGTDELFVTDGNKTTVLRWNETEFAKTPYDFPARLRAKGRDDTGVRFVDINGDKKLDLVQSNDESFTVWTFADNDIGWKEVRSGTPADANAIPLIARQDGTNNGAWFHSDHLWVQNEFTDRKPDLVERVPYRELVSVKKAASDEEHHPLGRAKSLDESIATFTLPAGAKLHVAAAEPEIQDPIAFDWGPNGELWVVEMGDYPNGANWHGPGDKKGDAGGRVKKLEDKDGDGRYETAHVFMDKLSSPTGIKSWRNGVLICAPPNIIYAEDTNGDHKADKREVLFTGMREGNQQHRANGLRWGLDHWLHLGNGDSGGVVRSTKTGNEVNTSGRDFRIKPDEGLIELTAGPTQFGRNRDAEGNWFGGDNSTPVWHYALDERYMRRNPHFSPPSARHQTAEVPGAAPVFPTSETVERFNDFDRANRFTSACSPEVYRMNSVYICEPVHNLVHRSVLRRDGASFASMRRDDEQQSEFLTSSDNWFRPVMVRTGPDRAIWVSDMYRMVIEHPEWIPMQWQKRIDHLSGNDKGRIYRITLPESESGPIQVTDAWKKIRGSNLLQLVELLRSESRVTRDMVQQEILRRNDRLCVPELKKLRKNNGPAQTAIDYLLHHFDAFDFELFANGGGFGLRSPQILRVLEPQLNSSKPLREMLLKLASEESLMKDERMRMQCAYSLGECSDARVGTLLGKIASDSLEHENDRYIRAAVMSSVSGSNVDRVMDAFLAREVSAGSRTAANEFLEDLVRSAVGFKNKAAVRSFVTKMASTPDALDDFAGPISSLLSSIRRQRKDLQSFVGTAATESLKKLAKQARDTAVADDATELKRLSAMQLFGFFPEFRKAEETALLDLLSPRQPTQLQRRAIEVLSEVGSSDSARIIMRRWSSFTPALRDTTLNVAVRNFDWTLVLLSGIQEGKVLPVQVGVRHRQQLLNHPNEDVRKAMGEIFQKASSNRDAVVQKYAGHGTSDPNLGNGKKVFAKQCAACHQLEGEGNDIGPDLTAISDKSMPAMLAAILDPNRAVEDKYLGYSAVTSDGEVHQGILLDESATAITLATAEGKQISVLRNQLDELKATGKSLMPEGLEQVLSPQDVADVVAYVQSISVPRKQFAGNEPQLAPVRDDGSIRLFAIHAEIYGPKIVLEEKYHNLGFWGDDNDRAVWTIDAPSAGEFELRLDYACAPQQSKNRFQIRVNGQVIGGEVESTGSWDNYRQQLIGTIKLPEEPVQLTIQSEGPIEGFLMDLRTILLYPPE